MRSIIYWLSLTFLLCTALAHAQDDLRISALEQPAYRFPVDIRIQSAATVGSTTLAVWGTMVSDGADSTIGALVMQRGSNGVAIGSAEILHTAEARPYGVVSVVGLDDRFLVIWNDRRQTAPGMYLRRVALDGAFLSDEELLAPNNYFPSDASVYLERMPEGYRLLWKVHVDMAPEIEENFYYYEQNLDRLGEPQQGIGRARVINFDDTLEYRDLPGARIIRRPDGSGQFYHSDGRLDPREIPANRLNRPFHLNSDTTIVVLGGEIGPSRWVAFHGSLFDTTFDRKVPLPSDDRYEFSYLGFISRDTSGTYGVIYSKLGTWDENGHWSMMGVILHRGLLLGGDSLTSDHIFDTLRGASNSVGAAGNYSSSSLTNGAFIAGDDNTGVIIATIGYFVHDRNSGNTSGSFVLKRMYLEDGQRTLSIIPQITDIRMRPEVQRILNDPMQSTVSVINGGDTLLFAAPNIPILPRVAHRQPVIIARGRDLIVAWRQMIRVPTFNLTRITRFESSGLFPMRSLVPDARGSYRTDNNNFINWSDLFATLGEGNGAITASATSRGGQETPQGKGPSCWHRKYMVVDTGWVNIYDRSNANWQYTDGVERVLFNPNTKEMTSATKFPVSHPSTLLIGCDSNAVIRIAQKQDGKLATNDPIWLLGLDSSNYGIVNYDSAFQVYNGVPSLTHVFSPGDPKSVRYYRLLGDGLLRVHPTDSLRSDGTLRDSTLNLEIYGLNGQRSGSYTMRLPSAEYRIAFAEHSSDTSIAFLWGADDGLHLTLLDKHLQPIITDSLLSARGDSLRNPSGLMRGDTLYAVWQDKRDGVDAIYANRWVLTNVFPRPPENPIHPGDSTTTKTPDPPIVTHPGIVDIYVGSIRPNPALDHAQLRVELPEATPIQIDLVDAMGRLVRHEERGNYPRGISDIAIDLRDLHPGAYLIRLHTNHGETTTRIVVLH